MTEGSAAGGMDDPKPRGGIDRLAPVVRLAPAKLNLTLAVTGRRDDGFHELHSVMVPLALADRLTLAPLAGRSDTLHVEGADTGPLEANLVLRAIAAARGEIGRIEIPGAPRPVPPPSLAARLEKRIPVAAGLAGGSSDAAAALDGALEAWAAALPPGVRQRIAATLGSDVPFFLAGGIALVEGRGERVRPLPDPLGSPAGVLLVTPAIAVPTADVFAAFAAGIRPDPWGVARVSSEHLAVELGAGLPVGSLLDRAGILATANDLIPATGRLVPELVSFRRGLRRLVGRPVGQSGSGPTLWALYPSLQAASAAASSVEDALASGELDAPGDAAPSVIATTLLPGGPRP
jgi:4-diphosphocytidyl-2-C-methyl-D-erythritol kinase